jgi:hypothetical protein
LYLETVAFFSKREVLDRKLVWNMFYWPMEHYWLACLAYVQFVQLRESRRTWENLSSELPRLRKYEGDAALSREAGIPQFLQTEAALVRERSARAPHS